MNLKLPGVLGKTGMGHFGFLFVSLIATFIVPELLPDEGSFRWQVPLFFTVVMLSALYAVSDRRAEFWVATTLLLFGLVPEWMNAFGVENTDIWGKLLIAVFLAYVAILILRFVLRATEIDVEVILGALCVYLLFALVWGVAYQIVALKHPGAFAIPPALLANAANPEQAIGAAMQYFSFVTITTLGYGDIQPVSSLARSLAITEALFGQIYLVTLIARLVSMESNQKLTGSRSRDET